MAEDEVQIIPLEGVIFDVSKLTVTEYVDHLEWASNPSKPRATMEHWAALFCKVIVECPPEWGEPDQPETYTSRSWIGEWEVLQGMFWAAVEDERKKVRAPSLRA
jgi:hypothetical protein